MKTVDRKQIMVYAKTSEDKVSLQRCGTSIEEYGKMLQALKWECRVEVYEGESVIDAIYARYRHDELQKLREIYESENATVVAAAQKLLHAQDENFMQDFERAGLKPLAEEIFEKLNALWASAVDDEGYFSEEMKQYMEEEISCMRRDLSYQAQFVFGRYRHITWGLDGEKYFSNRQHSVKYRGERAADRLLIYERTIAAYDPENDVALLQLESLSKRNKIERLKPDEVIDLARIWRVG